MLRALIQYWANDAAGTVTRVRRDVRHLRELGKQAATGVRAMASRAKVELERTLEHVADKLDEIHENGTKP